MMMVVVGAAMEGKGVARSQPQVHFGDSRKPSAHSAGIADMKCRGGGGGWYTWNGTVGTCGVRFTWRYLSAIVGGVQRSIDVRLHSMNAVALEETL